MGHNWDFNYDRRLVELTGDNVDLIPFRNPETGPISGDVLRMDAFGRVDVYELQADQSYSAPAGFYTRLVRKSDGSFAERDHAGRIVRYGVPDNLGNAPNDRDGRLERQHDDIQVQPVRPVGESCGYPGPPNRLLLQLRGPPGTRHHFAGRSLTFVHNSGGDLIEVTSPAVVGTPNGNDLPQGKTVRYAYSSGFVDERLNHNLLLVTYANEVALGGAPRVQFEYEEDPFAVDTTDRVLKQTLGGTNNTQVPAGGTMTYVYEAIPVVNTANLNAPVSRTTATDRSGNVTEYQFNRLGNVVRIREFTNKDLRASEPEFYETSNRFNADGKLVQTVYSQGNSIDDQNIDRM